MNTPTEPRVQAVRHVKVAYDELMEASVVNGVDRDLLDAISDVRIIVLQLGDRIEKGEL